MNLSIRVLCFALLVTLAKSFSESETDNMITKCKDENNIDTEEFNWFLNASIAEDYIEPKYRCLLQCLAREMDLVNSEGYLDISQIEQHVTLSDDNFHAINDCKKEYDIMTNMCEYYFQILICLQEKINFDNLDEVTDTYMD